MLNEQADLLARKVKHNLIAENGRTIETANAREFYNAFCRALREEVMAHWVATVETVRAKKPRVAYYLSMEYLPGRLTEHGVLNVGAGELVRATAAKLGRKVSDLYLAEPDPGLGNGGLGRLASCFLDSLATLQFPVRAYGLRYQYGVFEQEIWDGRQVERPDVWLLNENPWERRHDSAAVTVRFGNEEVRALAFDIPVIGYAKNHPYSVLTLRLWSTKESPRNFELQRFNEGFLDRASENLVLTDVLYPNDHNEMGKRIRLKQEFLLVSASLQNILQRQMLLFGSMENVADKVRIQINDTHPALVVPELIRSLQEHGLSWEKARDACMEICSYTNHTILREALVEWNEGQMRELLPKQHEVIQKLNGEFCDEVRKKFSGDEEKVRRLSILEHGHVRMAHLAVVGSHAVNGVAKLHSEILKERVFPEFDAMYPGKFTNVTNGVTHRRWLLKINPRLAQFVTERIGDGWVTNFGEIKKLEKFAKEKESQERFWEIKRENKRRLAEFLEKEDPVRDAHGMILSHRAKLDAKVLFDVQIKRIHEYKRQLMNALHVIMLRQQKRPGRVVLFGGKAAAGYERAKQIIQLISALSKVDDKVRVIFVENYNVSKAELLIPAADLSEQISTAGMEASGTGNMKLSMNGALTIGTDDGANVEMRASITDKWWPFGFGASAEENRKPYHPGEVYQRDEAVRKAVDALGEFGATELRQHLLEHDPYRVLQDLPAYAAAQKRVEELYAQPLLWAETAIHNMAGMGPFSTDESIRHYAKIWGIEPCPIDPKILARIETDYTVFRTANGH